MMTLAQALNRCIEHQDLTYDEMTFLFRQIMHGELSAVAIAALMMALRVKGESVTEITAAAQVMREMVNPVAIENKIHLVDIVGTGGDGAHTFNISTAAMFVAAAAGAKVAKHGGRAVSSQSGSADVLEALNIQLQLNPSQIAQCLEQTKIGFMFAPQHHPAMKYAAPVRKELGVKSIFNLLGPLTNPAGAPNIVLGVFAKTWVQKQAEVLKNLGMQRALVVWGHDNLDEISLSDATEVAELQDGKVKTYTITPEQFGLQRINADHFKVQNKQESLFKIKQALTNKDDALRNIVALNAAAALYVAGVSTSLAQGLSLAQTTIQTGAAFAKLEEVQKFTQKFIHLNV